MVSIEKRIVIEISGAKSSIHDRSKVAFYYRHDVRWIEVSNEVVNSSEAVRAICQALAFSVGSSHTVRLWGIQDVS